MLVTPPDIRDAGDLKLHMSIMRDGDLFFEGETNTNLMKRTISELLSFLFRDNPVPAGSVCFTGTGIVPPDDFSLKENDLVEIAADRIGVLRNPVTQL
jgi:2-dehydro-3-deoxy-D-arabinonate dehydratase